MGVCEEDCDRERFGALSWSSVGNFCEVMINGGFSPCKRIVSSASCSGWRDVWLRRASSKVVGESLFDMTEFHFRLDGFKRIVGPVSDGCSE